MFVKMIAVKIKLQLETSTCYYSIEEELINSLATYTFRCETLLKNKNNN